MGFDKFELSVFHCHHTFLRFIWILIFFNQDNYSKQLQHCIDTANENGAIELRMKITDEQVLYTSNMQINFTYV